MVGIPTSVAALPATTHLLCLNPRLSGSSSSLTRFPLPLVLPEAAEPGRGLPAAEPGAEPAVEEGRDPVDDLRPRFLPAAGGATESAGSTARLAELFLGRPILLCNAGLTLAPIHTLLQV